MPQTSFYRYLATSDDRLPRVARYIRRQIRYFAIPAPRLIVRPVLWCYLTARSGWHFFRRVFICEPLFKAYCTRYGRRLRTGIFVHWVQGKGSIILGDDCWIDGKSTITFAHRFSDCPTLQIGDHTGIGHECTLVIGKKITIGNHCAISGQTMIFDSNGHHTEVLERRAGLPPPPEEVREIRIGNDVWIGVRSIIFPGVRIGDGSIVSAGSVVRTHVPPYSVVSGNPARVVLRLRNPNIVAEAGVTPPMQPSSARDSASTNASGTPPV
jgi:acetyltransferase-like isoleucine patch superfamily enzyme